MPVDAISNLSLQSGEAVDYTVKSQLQPDAATYLGQQALQNARAARYTILAERWLIERQLKENQLRTRRLLEEAESVDSRLTAATQQVSK